MRWLLTALLMLLLATPATAQERRGRVVLEDGRTFEGVVLHLDQERVQLDVDGRRLTFRVMHIAKYELLTPEPEPAGVASEPEPEVTGDPTSAAQAEPVEGPDRTETVPAQEPRPAPAGETAKRTPRPAPTRANLLGQRLGFVQERYPWIGASGVLQWASVGLLVLLYVTMAMQLGARFANAESRESVKALILAILVLLAAIVQIAAVPFDALTLPVLLVGNAVGWLLLTRILYGLGFFASCTMFFSALLVCGMAFLVFEVVDYTLNSISGQQA